MSRSLIHIPVPTRLSLARLYGAPLPLSRARDSMCDAAVRSDSSDSGIAAVSAYVTGLYSYLATERRRDPERALASDVAVLFRWSSCVDPTRTHAYYTVRWEATMSAVLLGCLKFHRGRTEQASGRRARRSGDMPAARQAFTAARRAFGEAARAFDFAADEGCVPWISKRPEKSGHAPESDATVIRSLRDVAIAYATSALIDACELPAASEMPVRDEGPAPGRHVVKDSDPECIRMHADIAAFLQPKRMPLVPLVRELSAMHYATAALLQAQRLDDRGVAIVVMQVGVSKTGLPPDCEVAKQLRETIAEYMMSGTEALPSRTSVVLLEALPRTSPASTCTMDPAWPKFALTP